MLHTQYGGIFKIAAVLSVLHIMVLCSSGNIEILPNPTIEVLSKVIVILWFTYFSTFILTTCDAETGNLISLMKMSDFKTHYIKGDFIA